MSFDLHPEDKDHVYLEVYSISVKKVKIPEGSIKCPDCKGSGRIRYKYSEPSHSCADDFMPCILCQGKGYVELSYLAKFHPEKLPKEPSK